VDLRSVQTLGLRSSKELREYNFREIHPQYFLGAAVSARQCWGCLKVMIWHYLVAGPWIVLILYWWVSALKTRRTVLQEPFTSRYGILFLLVAGYILVFVYSDRRDIDSKIGLLGQHIFPRGLALAIGSVVLTWIGIGIALWARWHLGLYWSARVTLKEDHKLIRSGPYAYFRHPIYSGFDLAAIGGALAIDRWRCVVGVVLIIAGYWIKARKEESMLTDQFGPAFEEHCRVTGFLLPKI